MSESARSFFEPRFGRDFSGVRIHTSSEADEAARAIDAEAYTMGSDIAFASGNYDPGSTSGKKLLAHELTHVAQQDGDGTGPSRATAEVLRSPSDRDGEGGSGGDESRRGSGSTGRDGLKDGSETAKKVDDLIEKLEAEFGGDVKSKTEVGDELPPDVAEKIKRNPEAVHGYSPIEGTDLHQFLQQWEIDWSDPEDVKKVREERKPYKKRFEKLRQSLLDKLERAKQESEYTVENVTRDMVIQRNLQRVMAYIDDGNKAEIRKLVAADYSDPDKLVEDVRPHIENGDIEGLRNLFERNMTTHDRPQGPSFESYREDGKNYEAILRGCLKSNRAMDILVGLDDLSKNQVESTGSDQQ